MYGVHDVDARNILELVGTWWSKKERERNEEEEEEEEEIRKGLCWNISIVIVVL